MRQILDDALCRDFPALYRDRHADLAASSMGLGFGIGDGWEPIVRRLSERIEPLVVGTDIRCVRVKEKFGELCFLLTESADSNESRKMARAINSAEKDAARTCEACGATGRIRSRRRWIQVLCDHCASSPAHVENGHRDEDVETCLGCASMNKVPVKLDLRLNAKQARALEELLLIHGDRKIGKAARDASVDVSEHEIIGELVEREAKRLIKRLGSGRGRRAARR